MIVVTGHPRSGTSMMMQALIAGGLDAVYSDERDKVRQARCGTEYAPNPVNLFEPNAEQIRDLRHPEKAKAYDGKLVKLIFPIAMQLPIREEDHYRVIIMRRDPEEILQSYDAFFGTRYVPKALLEEDTEHNLKVLHNRRDMDLDEVWYRDVLRDPRMWLSYLRLPIDIDAAAAVPDASKIRYKIEELEVGICDAC